MTYLSLLYDSVTCEEESCKPISLGQRNGSIEHFFYVLMEGLGQRSLGPRMTHILHFFWSNKILFFVWFVFVFVFFFFFEALGVVSMIKDI